MTVEEQSDHWTVTVMGYVTIIKIVGGLLLWLKVKC